MMFNLEGMTALVTGASGGIGSAIARSLSPFEPDSAIRAPWRARE